MIINHVFEKSTMLNNASYNTENNEMIVTFQGGKSYIYVDVDRRLFDELISAQSAGKYFNNCKKDLKVK